MRSSAISRSLCLALLATAAHAQTVSAGARAVVNTDSLPVYATMSASSAVKATLTRGDTVTIGLVLFGDDVTWCAISKADDNKRIGYASCEFLERERPAPPAVAPAPALPPEQPKPAPKPFTIREVPRPPVEPIAIPEAPPIPAAAALPPAPKLELKPPAYDDFVDTVLDASGVGASLVVYTQDTHLLSFLDKGRLAEIDVPALERVLSEQFKPSAFRVAIGTQFRKNYSPERLPLLLEWLRSPLTKKLADMESHALKPESRDDLVVYAANLSKLAPEESRLLLIHRLYDSLRTCDMEVDTTISLVQTVALAIGPALPKEKRYSASDLKQALAEVKLRYGSIMKNARIVRYLFAYRSATDAELEQQVNFLESESGKWFVSLVEKGFSDANEAISRALSAEIGQKVKSKRR